GMEHEIELPAEVFRPAGDEVFEVCDAGGIGRYHDGPAFFGEFADVAHADGDGGVGQHEFRTLFAGAFGYFPGDGFVVERAEYQAALPFEEIVGHKFPFRSAGTKIRTCFRFAATPGRTVATESVHVFRFFEYLCASALLREHIKNIEYETF